MRMLGGRDTWVTVAGFALALVLCLYYQANALIVGPLRADAAQYAKLAINLVQHHVLSGADPGATVFLPESYRTPGYPLILAIIYRLSGQTLHGLYQATLAVQAVMAALTVALVFRIGRHFLSFWPAVAASLLLALWPMSITQSGYVLTETAFGFFLSAGVWMACVADARASRTLYAVSGALLAFSASINPMIGLFVLMLAAVLWMRRERAMALIVFITIALPCVAWQVRSAHLPPASAGVSQGHRLAENILLGMSPDFKQYFADQESPEGARIFGEFKRMLDLHDQHPAAFYGELVQRVASRPGKYLHWYLIEKPADIWSWPIVQGAGGIYQYTNIQSPFETNAFYRLTAMISITLSTVFVLLALIGAVRGVLGWLLGWHRSWPQLVLGLLFWYFSLLYWVLTPDGRYVTPFRGCEFLLAVSAIVSMASTLQSRRDRAVPSLSRDAVDAGMASH